MRTRANSLVPKLPITLFDSLVSRRRALRLDLQRAPRKIELVVHHNQAVRFQLVPFEQPLYRRAAQIHDTFAAWPAPRCFPPIAPNPTNDIFSFRLTRIACDSASRSITMNPRLCGVFSYSSPGFPRPTIRNSTRVRPSSALATWPLAPGPWLISSSSCRRPRRLPLPSCPS